MYRLALCLRLLRSRRISFFSVAGIAVGVMAFMVVLAIMNGLSGVLVRVIRGSLSDITVRAEDIRGFADYQGMMAEIQEVPHVTGCAPRLEGLAFLERRIDRRKATVPCTFVGVDPKLEKQVGDFHRYVIKGNSDFSFPGVAVENPVIVGAELAHRLLINVGTELVIITPINFDTDNVLRFTTVGLYKSGIYENDSGMVFMPLEVAQRFRFVPAEARISSIQVKLEDPRHSETVKQQLKDLLASRGDFYVGSWYDMRAKLLGAIATEKVIWVIVLSLLLCVAGFTIVAILNMIVVEKVKDIGILRALGGSTGGVGATFLLYGLAIGVIGTTLGMVGSILFLHNMERLEKLLGWSPFPRVIFYMESIPWEITPLYGVLIVSLGIGVSLASSVYPALRAARQDPVQALHST